MFKKILSKSIKFQRTPNPFIQIFQIQKRFAETKKAFDIYIFEVVNAFLIFMETSNNFAFNCIESLGLTMRKSTICTLF